MLIAGALLLLAFLTHAFVGDKEYRALQPETEAPSKHKDAWVQVRSGWHWVSVDLLLFGCVLLLMATTELIKAKVALFGLGNVSMFGVV